MARRNSGIRFASIAVAVTLLLAGCVPGFGGEEQRDSRLYLGPIPAPAAMPPEPEMPPAPTMPTDLNDSAALDAYMDASEVYAEALMANQTEIGEHYDAVRALADSTRAGGEQSVAVWQTLLVTAGIAVAGDDGKPIEINGDTGFGWAMSDAELRLHAVLATAPGGVRLIDLADALAAGIDMSGPELAQAIFDDLYLVEDTGFSKVLSSVQPDLLFAGTRARAIDEVVLSWPSAGLVLRRLSAELAVSDAGAVDRDEGASSAGVNPTIALAGFSGSVNASASKRPCEINIDSPPWVAEMVNQIVKVHTFVFDEAIEHIDAATDTKKRTTAGRTIGIARLVLAMYTLYAKVASLQASFTMDNAPLVRTKNTQAGETRDLTLKFEFSKTAGDEIRECMNLFLAPFGLDAQGSQEGVAENIDVQLYSDRPSVVRIGDGKGSKSDVTQARTDSGGNAKFRVSGAPQDDLLPEVAQAEDIDVSLRAVSNLGANDFFKDLASLPWDALDAAGTGGLSVVPIVLSKMKLYTVTGTIPVRDWSLEADFEATLVGSFEKRWAGHNRFPDACSGGWVVHTSSVDTSSSFATDTVQVSAALLSNPHGNLGDQAAVFHPTGEELDPGYSSEGALMFNMPVHYQTTQSQHRPAVGPIPPEEVTGGGGCADRGDGPVEVAPPEPDCSATQYSGNLEVAMPAARTLYAVGDESSHVYTRADCGGGPAAPATNGCKRSGGKMPPINELFDPANTIIEVDGSLACSEERAGHMSKLDYHWTLVLCRIVDGKSAC